MGDMFCREREGGRGREEGESTIPML